MLSLISLCRGRSLQGTYSHSSNTVTLDSIHIHTHSYSLSNTHTHIYKCKVKLNSFSFLRKIESDGKRESVFECVRERESESEKEKGTTSEWVKERVCLCLSSQRERAEIVASPHVMSSCFSQSCFELWINKIYHISSELGVFQLIFKFIINL